MTFEVDVNGRTRTVSVERTAAGHYRVAVDGHPHEIDAVRVGELGLSLLIGGVVIDGGDSHRGQSGLTVPTRGISREIQVAPSSVRGELLVGIDGRTVSAAVNARRTGRGGADAGGSAHGEQPVLAPMPGRVVRVLVAAGDQVAAKQSVVVVEAMKMENELRSPKAGRVKEVSVTPGTLVETGRVLMVIE